MQTPTTVQEKKEQNRRAFDEFARLHGETPAASTIFESVTVDEDARPDGAPILVADFVGSAGALSAGQLAGVLADQLARDHGAVWSQIVPTVGRELATLELRSSNSRRLGSVMVLRGPAPEESAAAALLTLTTGRRVEWLDVEGETDAEAWASVGADVRRAARVMVERYGKELTARGYIEALAGDEVSAFDAYERKALAFAMVATIAD